MLSPKSLIEQWEAEGEFQILSILHVRLSTCNLLSSQGGFQALTNGFGHVIYLFPTECGPGESQNPLEGTAYLANTHHAPLLLVSIPPTQACNHSLARCGLEHVFTSW